MAEKKKSAGQSTLRNRNQVRSQTGASAKPQSSEKEQPVKSISAMARDEQASSTKSAKATERKEPVKQDNKPRTSSKSPSSLETRFRSSRIGRFVLEAYYELRHKVTWPTFEEARNMTIVVIGLSAVIGAVLGLADLGLTQLFLLISGGK